MPSLIFSNASALRILPYATKIEALRVFKGSIQVTYSTKNGRCSTFLSKKAFYNDFITFRIEGALSCTVKRWGAGSYQNRYDVFSSKSEKIYVVELVAGTAMCSCPDHDQQQKHLGKAKPGCKHILSVMSQLGHASLQDYRDSVAAKASMMRCLICGGSGAIHDRDDYPIERCYHCKGLGYEKVVDLSETAKLELATSTPSVTAAKKTQVDPFGGFNF
ncbi:MAG TPA: hypothetical protein V6D09_12245 [Leptolyngbyaceae cyanobacterium]